MLPHPATRSSLTGALRTTLVLFLLSTPLEAGGELADLTPCPSPRRLFRRVPGFGVCALPPLVQRSPVPIVKVFPQPAVVCVGGVGQKTAIFVCLSFFAVLHLFDRRLAPSR